MKLLPEYYIVVDIEASGPTPDRYAMLSLGAATVGQQQESFYIEFKPDSEGYQEESLSICGLSMEELKETGIPAPEGMKQFADWVNNVTPDGHSPVFTAFNAPFDWMYVNTYFHRYLSYNPFGHKALDIKALYMGLFQVPFLATSHYHICQHYGLTSSLSHHALEDALQEADLLQKLLVELKRKEIK
jgi:DNA polymerase III epsilon subunit-like protein